MTPQREEAARMMRLAMRDQAAFVTLLSAPSVALSLALFHAQQSVEKALKAVMCLRGLEFRHTHDLEELAGQLADTGQGPAIGISELQRLVPYAVKFHYDDESPHLLTGAQAQTIVAFVLAWAESQIAAASI